MFTWSIMQSLLHDFCKHSKLKSIILHCSIEKTEKHMIFLLLGKLADRSFSRQGKNEKFRRQFLS